MLEPSVLYEDGRWRMWYVGFGHDPEDPDDVSYSRIGYAESTDGVTWAKRPEPVLVGGGDGFESLGVSHPNVVADPRGGYHLFYVGIGADEELRMGHAYSTDGIVWEADARSFDFTFVSKQAERLVGYPIEDWLRPGFWLEHLHPDDRNWAPEYCRSCTERLERHEFEYRLLSRDGRVVWLHDLVTVVAEHGAPRWLRGIMVDISRRRNAEEKLRGLADELETKVQERTAQLRRISAQLTMTEERERRMLAESLHDNL